MQVCEGTYQLLQVPSADLHVALVLIHALRELLSINFAASCPPVALRVLSLGCNGIVVLRLLNGLARTTPEEATDCVAD